MKSQFFPNRVVWRLGLVTGLSREFKLRVNGLASLRLLSCSATVGITLQLPCMLHPRVQSWVSASLHNLEHFFTLFHSLPLHDSHPNTGLLIAKIQANLAWIKANKMVDKIQPYKVKNLSAALQAKINTLVNKLEYTNIKKTLTV